MDLKNRKSGWWLGVAALVTSALLVYVGTGLHPRAWAIWIAAVPVLAYAARARLWPALFVALGAWALGGLNLWSVLSDVIRLPLPIRLLVVLQPAVLFAVAVWLWRRQIVRGAVWRAVFVMPCFWVVMEFLTTRSSPHGTFGSLAYTQMEFLPVVQLAAATGIYGVSFAIFLAAAALGVLMAPTVAKPDKWRVGLVGVVVFGAVFALGALRLSSHRDGASVLMVGLAASGDEARLFPTDSATAQKLLTEYADISANLARVGAELVVLPEKIAWLGAPEALAARSRFRAVALENRVGIVVGWARREGQKVWNEAVLFQADGSELSYEKRHMLPGFEDDCVVGEGYTTAANAGQRWGLAICKDMDFSEISRAYGARGAALLLVPAWDFSVDGWLHSRMAMMRGVEGGFTIARAAKQGLLTVSDQSGRVVAQTEVVGAGFSTLVAKVQPVSEATFYRRWGDWFAWFCVLAAAMLLFVPGAPRSRS